MLSAQSFLMIPVPALIYGMKAKTGIGIREAWVIEQRSSFVAKQRRCRGSTLKAFPNRNPTPGV
jgi:hypothetical protein